MVRACRPRSGVTWPATSSMRILFFQPDFSTYISGYYQHHFLVELKKRHEVFEYGPAKSGPGYPYYDRNHSIEDVLKVCPFEPDVICFGAGWERFDETGEFDPHPAITTRDVSIPAVMILNKEYHNLEKKFQYIRDNEIGLVFTSHHDLDKWQGLLEVPFVKMPFAVNPEIFRKYNVPMRYDFGFAGNLHLKWTDLRRKIKHRMFWFGRRRLPAFKYRKLKVYWQEWGEGLRTGADYAKLIESSKLWLSTTSAVDLVGTRFYEIMAVGSLLFCNRKSVYNGLFEDKKHCVMFSEDLSDFDELLWYYVNNDEERKAVTERAVCHVRENHTWKNRVDLFTREVENIL